MRSAISRVLAAMFFSWLLLASPVFADLTGDVQGTVSDPTGAGVAGAKVSIKNLATGQTRVVIASQSGEYSAPQMEIGSYQISVEKDGFKTYTQTVVVRSGEKTRVDAQMQIGKVTETI